MATKQKITNDLQALELLKTVLPKAVSDPKLAAKIFTACELEIKSKARGVSFEEFCAGCDLPDLRPESVAQVKQQLETSFGKDNVSVLPHPQKKALSVEVVLPDQIFEGVVKVTSPHPANGEAEEEVKPKLAPFPVALPGDPELVWILGRTEDRSPEEAAIALARVEEDFWASKAGQKLLQDRVERSFPEFIGRAPAKMLAEAGLKRHYKEPEPIKQLKVLKARKSTAGARRE